MPYNSGQRSALASAYALDDMWKIRTVFFALLFGTTTVLSFADPEVEVSAKIVNFHIDPFFPTEAQILNEDGSVSGNTTLHGPCAVATFEIIDPKNEQGNLITINFTDGRFQKSKKKENMEERVKNGAIFTFSIPSDYFESEYQSIDGAFVKELKTTHIQSSHTTPASAPR